MSAELGTIYEDYEIFPLVFVRGGRNAMRRAESERGYNVGVRIFRLNREAVEVVEGVEPVAVPSRVFKVDTDVFYPQFGDARRAALEYGRRVIKGEIPNESVEGL